mmetsp:Transcript_49793/g.125189  ORF Transcript_49793/g.125189 Transcript_49793/m.125189 type:complete len:232 (-) Transcript_49793:628-1323(-)
MFCRDSMDSSRLEIKGHGTAPFSLDPLHRESTVLDGFAVPSVSDMHHAVFALYNTRVGVLDDGVASALAGWLRDRRLKVPLEWPRHAAVVAQCDCQWRAVVGVSTRGIVEYQGDWSPLGRMHDIDLNRRIIVWKRSRHRYGPCAPQVVRMGIINPFGSAIAEKSTQLRPMRVWPPPKRWLNQVIGSLNGEVSPTPIEIPVQVRINLHGTVLVAVVTARAVYGKYEAPIPRP